MYEKSLTQPIDGIMNSVSTLTNARGGDGDGETKKKKSIINLVTVDIENVTEAREWLFFGEIRSRSRSRSLPLPFLFPLPPPPFHLHVLPLFFPAPSEFVTSV